MSLTYGEQRTEKQKLYDEAVMTRVKHGIALMEREHGLNWVDYIDLRRLDLQNDEACVLGQMYGSWGDTVEDLFGDEEAPFDVSAEHGFTLTEDEEDEFGAGAWDRLQAAWEDALTPIVRRQDT